MTKIVCSHTNCDDVVACSHTRATAKTSLWDHSILEVGTRRNKGVRVLKSSLVPIVPNRKSWHVLPGPLRADISVGIVALGTASLSTSIGSAKGGSRVSWSCETYVSSLVFCDWSKRAAKKRPHAVPCFEIDKLRPRPVSLVNCAVGLYGATTTVGDILFNLINPETGNRIHIVTTDSSS
jgi:hypothetical protein